MGRSFGDNQIFPGGNQQLNRVLIVVDLLEDVDRIDLRAFTDLVFGKDLKNAHSVFSVPIFTISAIARLVELKQFIVDHQNIFSSFNRYQLLGLLLTRSIVCPTAELMIAER